MNVVFSLLGDPANQYNSLTNIGHFINKGGGMIVTKLHVGREQGNPLRTSVF